MGIGHGIYAITNNPEAVHVVLYAAIDRTATVMEERHNESKRSRAATTREKKLVDKAAKKAKKTKKEVERVDNKEPVQQDFRRLTDSKQPLPILADELATPTIELPTGATDEKMDPFLST
ncbi:hypothetical protein K432DRAFT_462522 [Lepidopterella palustris CBS 459.81]|uniref:Uncharacterized protein n=1 Tax=Lepidopterella palustris CBS 459.81 TaxID=1314670 RepID=A0A8E2E3V0_9PEZI|nr:hypothetical protein K432DRAFT_462522 [Lepidopterella palustris CBS 459.81]